MMKFDEFRAFSEQDRRGERSRKKWTLISPPKGHLYVMVSFKNTGDAKERLTRTRTVLCTHAPRSFG